MTKYFPDCLDTFPSVSLYIFMQGSCLPQKLILTVVLIAKKIKKVITHQITIGSLVKMTVKKRFIYILFDVQKTVNICVVHFEPPRDEHQWVRKHEVLTGCRQPAWGH